MILEHVQVNVQPPDNPRYKWKRAVIREVVYARTPQTETVYHPMKVEDAKNLGAKIKRERNCRYEPWPAFLLQ